MDTRNGKMDPRLRMAGMAWLLSRLAVYTCLLWRLGGVNGLVLQLGNELGKSTATTFLYDWIRSFFHFMNQVVANSGTWTYLVAGELVLLASAVGVYTYARRFTAPQVAERTTWMWAFSPAIFVTILGSPWVFTIGLVTLSYGLVAQRRTLLATLTGCLGVGLCPEVVLVTPVLIAEAWSVRQKSGDEWGSLLMTVGLPSSFVITVFSTILFGDGVKAFQGPAIWRSDWSLSAFVDFFTTPSLDWIVCGMVVVAVVLQLLSSSQLPKRMMLSIVALLWPLLFVPGVYAMGILCCTIPAYIALALHTEDPEYERPILLGSMLLLMVMFFYGLG